jgi:hypothetical protein
LEHSGFSNILWDLVYDAVDDDVKGWVETMEDMESIFLRI